MFLLPIVIFIVTHQRDFRDFTPDHDLHTAIVISMFLLTNGIFVFLLPIVIFMFTLDRDFH
jgi:hypothetical protein